MKTRIFFIICFVLTLFISLPVYASSSIATEEEDVDFALSQESLTLIDGELVNQPLLQQVVDEYFGIRESNISNDNSVLFNEYNAFNTTLLNSISGSSKIAMDEQNRADGIKELGDRLGVYYVTKQAVPTILRATLKNSNTVELFVSEWTWIEYNYDNSGQATDEMGFSTSHIIALENSEKGYKIVSDVYDELEITGVRTSAFTEAEIKSVTSQFYIQEYEINGVAKIDNFTIADADPPFREYDLNGLIWYADKYVKHDYTSGSEQSYWNTSEYNSFSSDCANFVSQCIRSGANQWPDDTWYPYTSKWTTVPDLEAYLRGRFSKSRLNATASNVKPGNPVFWLNGDGNPSSGSHIMICTGYSSAGVPFINAHTRDIYHMPWNYASNYKLYTIQISPFIMELPSNALNLGALYHGYSVEFPNEYIPLQQSNWYKFTVNEELYIDIGSAYGADRINVDAVLYQESFTPSTQQLAMYELISDTNSGSGLNFKFRIRLKPGITYYLRVYAEPEAQGRFILCIEANKQSSW